MGRHADSSPLSDVNRTHSFSALAMEKVGYSGEQCVGVHIIPHGRFIFRCLYFGYCKYPTEYPALRPSL